MHFCHRFRKNKSSRIIESLIALQLHQILDPSIFPKHFCRQVLCDLCWKVIWNKRQEQYIHPPFCWVLRGKNMFHCVFIQSRDTPWHILDFILKNHLLHSIAKTVPRKYLIPLRERPSLRSLPFFMTHCFAEFCNKKTTLQQIVKMRSAKNILKQKYASSIEWAPQLLLAYYSNLIKRLLSKSHNHSNCTRKRKLISCSAQLLLSNSPIPDN